MEKIYTHNAEGEKVLIEYTKTVLTDTKPKPYIVIDDSEDGFSRFKLCLRRADEEKQYANGMGDKSYAAALARLVADNHDLYVKFVKRLRQEFADQRK
ncbi:hypothetical protein [Butyrivibrio sp. AE2015]|uniref:hypothetical protein n=1 Tax=Butyrivibrio sp. AE2015 TaxID=1280663 RepID=UPI0003B5EFF3|nr:hypothetical protein [Butyrivibrio sp. AE2015]